MPDNAGLNAITGITPERTAAVMVLMQRLAAIEPTGFPLTWDRPTAAEILTCLRDFLDTAAGEKCEPEYRVCGIASEVLGDLIAHIHELDEGRSDPRLYPVPGGGSPSGTIQGMRNSLLAMVNGKAEHYKSEGVRDFKARARQEVADHAKANGWKWPLADREREIDATLLRSWEKGLGRSNWSSHN